MCLQWSEGELWSDNFDILIFIECRTLNHLGSMSCREFLKKHVEYVLNKIDPEADVVADIENVAARGRLLFLIDGLDEITGVSQLSTITPKFSPTEPLSPLELVQSLLSGRLAAGSHIIVTSRPHTLTYLQVFIKIISFIHSVIPRQSGPQVFFRFGRRQISTVY